MARSSENSNNSDIEIEPLPMPTIDTELGEKLEERMKKIEKEVKSLTEKKLDLDKYDLD